MQRATFFAICFTFHISSLTSKHPQMYLTRAINPVFFPNWSTDWGATDVKCCQLLSRANHAESLRLSFNFRSKARLKEQIQLVHNGGSRPLLLIAKQNHTRKVFNCFSTQFDQGSVYGGKLTCLCTVGRAKEIRTTQHCGPGWRKVIKSSDRNLVEEVSPCTLYF